MIDANYSKPMTYFQSLAKTFSRENTHWLATGVIDVFSRYYLGVISFLVVMIAFNQFVYVGISLDQSFPDDHLYIALKKDVIPEKGQKMAVRTVKGPFGPPEGLILAKRVYGIPGDIVTVGGKDGREVFINGERVAYAKKFSKHGKPLTVTRGGTIPPRMLYVGTPSKDSYDSRYATLGFVPYDRIVGRIYTLF